MLAARQHLAQQSSDIFRPATKRIDAACHDLFTLSGQIAQAESPASCHSVGL